MPGKTLDTGPGLKYNPLLGETEIRPNMVPEKISGSPARNRSAGFGHSAEGAGHPHRGTDGQLDASPTAFEVRLDVFEGPLDLLLRLIEQRELDITKVSLIAVTDQYLEYVRILQDIRVDFLADFLVVAAKLLLIKSRALLPSPPPEEDTEEEDIGDQLARQLREYKRFKEAAMALGTREAEGLHSYPRVAAPPVVQPRLDLGDVTLDDLVTSLRGLLSAEQPSMAVDRVVPPLRITLDEKIEHVVRVTRYYKRISFRRLLKDSSSRLEIIVTFLAILELIKQRRLIVGQDRPFGRIMISAREEATLESNQDLRSGT